MRYYDNPVIQTFETIDAYLCRRIGYYKRANSVYYAGKLQGITEFAKALIASDNVQSAIDAMDSVMFFASKLDNDFNAGMTNSIRHMTRRITNLDHDMSKISFETYKQMRSEHYNVEFYDNDGDMLMFANYYINKEDAIKELITSMYAYDNLDSSDTYHFNKALLVHVYGDNETIELRHYFEDGVARLLQELK